MRSAAVLQAAKRYSRGRWPRRDRELCRHCGRADELHHGPEHFCTQSAEKLRQQLAVVTQLRAADAFLRGVKNTIRGKPWDSRSGAHDVAAGAGTPSMKLRGGEGGIDYRKWEHLEEDSSDMERGRRNRAGLASAEWDLCRKAEDGDFSSGLDDADGLPFGEEHHRAPAVCGEGPAVRATLEEHEDTSSTDGADVEVSSASSGEEACDDDNVIVHVHADTRVPGAGLHAGVQSAEHVRTAERGDEDAIMSEELGTSRRNEDPQRVSAGQEGGGGLVGSTGTLPILPDAVAPHAPKTARATAILSRAGHLRSAGSRQTKIAQDTQGSGPSKVKLTNRELEHATVRRQVLNSGGLPGVNICNMHDGVSRTEDLLYEWEQSYFDVNVYIPLARFTRSPAKLGGGTAAAAAEGFGDEGVGEVSRAHV